MIRLNNKLELKNLKGQFSMDYSKKLKNLLDKFKKRAEYEVSDSHYYRPISEALLVQNKKLPYKSAALTISQDETNKTQHILEISLLHNSMVKEIKRPLVAGDKKEILQFLNDNNSLNILKNDISEMSQKLSSL